MYIEVIKCRSVKRTAQLIDAAHFYAKQLLHPNMSRHIHLEIEQDPALEDQGDCDTVEAGRRPRWFKIRLRGGKDDEPILCTLAHEMVHLKQFAIGELYGDISFFRSDGTTGITACWNGKIYMPMPGEMHSCSPWESEAFCKELSLYYQYLASHAQAA